jgi:hypothetical protein
MPLRKTDWNLWIFVKCNNMGDVKKLEVINLKALEQQCVPDTRKF